MYFDERVPRLRLVYADHTATATITASATATGYSTESLKSDLKSRFHRIPGVSGSYTLKWASSKVVGVVALPASNLTASASARVRLYSDEACTALLADSGDKLACPANNLGVFGVSAVTGYHFFRGAASKAAVWFDTPVPGVKGCVVDMSDLANPAGFIDSSRLVVGTYWQSPVGVEYGAQIGTHDAAKADRGLSGDVSALEGYTVDKASLTLRGLSSESRAEILKVVRGRSHCQTLLSVLPGYPESESAEALMTPEEVAELNAANGIYLKDGYVAGGYVFNDPPPDYPRLSPRALSSARTMEQDLTIYGRILTAPPALDAFDEWTLKIDVEGW